MNRLLRALWDRLLPPGGEPDGDGPWVEVHVLKPLRFRDAKPEPDDLGPGELCWWWDPEERHWLLVYPSSLNPGDLWLPYWAIADPSAEP